MTSAIFRSFLLINNGMSTFFTLSVVGFIASVDVSRVCSNDDYMYTIGIHRREFVLTRYA